MLMGFLKRVRKLFGKGKKPDIASQQLMHGMKMRTSGRLDRKQPPPLKKKPN